MSADTNSNAELTMRVRTLEADVAELQRKVDEEIRLLKLVIADLRRREADA